MALPWTPPTKSTSGGNKLALHYASYFPSTASEIAAASVIGPLMKSFAGKELSDDEIQRRIKRAIPANHAEYFPSDLDLLFDFGTKKATTKPLALVCALRNFHRKYDPSNPVFTARLPASTAKVDDPWERDFDNDKHTHPMLGMTENLAFLEHILHRLRSLPLATQRNSNLVQKWMEEQDFRYPVVLRKGDPPVDCKIEFEGLVGWSVDVFIKNQQGFGLLNVVELPDHIKERIYYPPGTEKKLVVGDGGDAPPAMRKLCTDYALDYLVFHRQLPPSILRELYLFAGYLQNYRLASTPRGTIAFLQIFDFHEHHEGLTDKDEQKGLDMYGLKKGQVLRLDLGNGGTGSGAVSLNSEGYKYYLQYIREHPKASLYQKPTPCDALLSLPAFAAIRHARTRGPRFARFFHAVDKLNLPLPEQAAWIDAERTRCGRSCQNKQCGMNELADLPIGLGDVFASATDSNLFLCFSCWTRSLVAEMSGISSADFQRELDADPTTKGLCGIKDRVGAFVQCPMGCLSRFGQYSMTLEIKYTLGSTLLVCEKCATSHCAKQYNELVVQSQRLLADGKPRAQLPPVKLNIPGRGSDTCSACRGRFPATKGYDQDSQRLLIPYLNEEGQVICNGCFAKGRDRFRELSPVHFSPFVKRLTASPTLATLMSLAREASTSTWFMAPSQILVDLRSTRAKEKAGPRLYADFEAALRQFEFGLDA